MATNNEITTGKQTNGQFTITYQQNGYGGCIPVIDGKPEQSLMFGYVTESDKRGCMKLIEEAIVATQGNIWKAKEYIMNAVVMAANEVKPTDTAEADGVEILIDYENRKAYETTTEIANLDDIKCDLPEEAIKALLVERAKNAIKERREAEERTYVDLDYDDEDDYE